MSLSGSYSKPSLDNVPSGVETISEGTAVILSDIDRVFYNKVQVFNRDMSVLVLKEFQQLRESEWEKTQERRKTKKQRTMENASSNTANQQTPQTSSDQPETVKPSDQPQTTSDQPQSLPKLKILEALSASGLRSIRYWNEVEGIESIIANDLDKQAVADIQRNIEFNQCAHGIKVSHNDATDIMYDHRTNSLTRRGRERGFHVIDLDPYGTASPFLDAAIQAIHVGGLLCVTCTDLAVLAGPNQGTCWSKYGAVPHKAKYCHEMAIRMLLQTIQNIAAKYKRYIVPLISFQVDFYIRVFVRVFHSPSIVKSIFKKLGYVLQCSECSAFHIQPMSRPEQRKTSQPGVLVHDSKCGECGGSIKIGGPIWIDEIHDQSFVRNMLINVESNEEHFATHKRMKAVLELIEQELPNQPLFFHAPTLSCNVKASTIPKKVLHSALINAGYSISKCHVDPSGIKTDAPTSAIFQIIRQWATEISKEGRIYRESSLEHRIMVQHAPKDPPKYDFTLNPKAIQLDSIGAYYPNPERFWGPKSKAKGEPLKRKRDQQSGNEQ